MLHAENETRYAMLKNPKAFKRVKPSKKKGKGKKKAGGRGRSKSKTAKGGRTLAVQLPGRCGCIACMCFAGYLMGVLGMCLQDPRNPLLRNAAARNNGTGTGDRENCHVLPPNVIFSIGANSVEISRQSTHRHFCKTLPALEVRTRPPQQLLRSVTLLSLCSIRGVDDNKHRALSGSRRTAAVAMASLKPGVYQFEGCTINSNDHNKTPVCVLSSMRNGRHKCPVHRRPARVLFHQPCSAVPAAYLVQDN